MCTNVFHEGQMVYLANQSHGQMHLEEIEPSGLYLELDNLEGLNEDFPILF